MTKEEAINEMKKGNKVTHRFFDETEWITMIGNIIRMEKGQECWASEFWKDRQGKAWDEGWFIYNN